MSRVNPCSEFDNLSDIQLLEVMLTNDNAHSCIYLRHKTYCINFMMSKGAAEFDAEDIYHDATIVLYEKKQNPDFKLTCSIQAFLNSICFNQLRAKAKSSYNLKTVYTDDVDESIQDWFEENDEETANKIDKILLALADLKTKGDKCYDRLKLFYYDKLSTSEIAKRLALKNADVVQNLINRCRNILKQMVGV